MGLEKESKTKQKKEKRHNSQHIRGLFQIVPATQKENSRGKKNIDQNLEFVR